MYVHVLYFASSSLSIAAGTRSRAQLRPYSQTVRPLSSHTDPVLRHRIHIRQKQFSHIYGQKQRQCWCYCDLTATLQAHFWRPVWPQAWCSQTCTSVTNHNEIFIPICASAGWTFSLQVTPHTHTRVFTSAGLTMWN